MIRTHPSAQPNDAILTLLVRCVEAIEAGEPPEEGIESLTQAILRETETSDWRSTLEADWLAQGAREAATALYNRLNHYVTRSTGAAARQEQIASLAESLPDAIFFAPRMIAHLYSPNAPSGDQMITRGIDLHCRFIRRAVSQVMRRYGGSIRHLSIDAVALQDDLYSCALEEVVKALSDSNARVWRVGESEPILFPPARRKGWKQALIVRVAMDPPTTQLATLRSDGLLGVWSMEEAALIRTWNLPIPPSDGDHDSWHEPYFSRNGERIAWQTASDRIAVVSIHEENSRIEIYSNEEREAFLSVFGEPHLPRRNALNPDLYTLSNRWGEPVNAAKYQSAVYHWTCDAAGTVFATASEIDRGMPQWMRDIGFQNAVYHILKRRLIDLVRKQTLGESSAPSADAGHEPQEGGGLNVQIPIDAMSAADLVASSTSNGDDWRSQHDMERILAVLGEITISYKNRAIRCDVLAKLKAEGKTNAEIGEEIGVPRGTVDYLWNQCREQICLIFGDDIV